MTIHKHFFAVNYILIGFFFVIAMAPLMGSAENLKEGTRGFPPRKRPPALPEKREGKRKWSSTKQQKNNLLNSCHLASINILVIVLISKKINLIIARTEQEKTQSSVMPLASKTPPFIKSISLFNLS